MLCAARQSSRTRAVTALGWWRAAATATQTKSRRSGKQRLLNAKRNERLRWKRENPHADYGLPFYGTIDATPPPRPPAAEVSLYTMSDEMRRALAEVEVSSLSEEQRFSKTSTPDEREEFVRSLRYNHGAPLNIDWRSLPFSMCRNHITSASPAMWLYFLNLLRRVHCVGTRNVRGREQTMQGILTTRDAPHPTAVALELLYPDTSRGTRFTIRPCVHHSTYLPCFLECRRRISQANSQAMVLVESAAVHLLWRTIRHSLRMTDSPLLIYAYTSSLVLLRDAAGLDDLLQRDTSQRLHHTVNHAQLLSALAKVRLLEGDVEGTTEATRAYLHSEKDTLARFILAVPLLVHHLRTQCCVSDDTVAILEEIGGVDNVVAGKGAEASVVWLYIEELVQVRGLGVGECQKLLRLLLGAELAGAPSRWSAGTVEAMIRQHGDAVGGAYRLLKDGSQSGTADGWVIPGKEGGRLTDSPPPECFAAFVAVLGEAGSGPHRIAKIVRHMMALGLRPGHTVVHHLLLSAARHDYEALKRALRWVVLAPQYRPSDHTLEEVMEVLPSTLSTDEVTEIFDEVIGLAGGCVSKVVYHYVRRLVEREGLRGAVDHFCHKMRNEAYKKAYVEFGDAFKLTLEDPACCEALLLAYESCGTLPRGDELTAVERMAVPLTQGGYSLRVTAAGEAILRPPPRQTTAESDETVAVDIAWLAPYGMHHLRPLRTMSCDGVVTETASGVATQLHNRQILLIHWSALMWCDDVFRIFGELGGDSTKGPLSLIPARQLLHFFRCATARDEEFAEAIACATAMTAPEARWAERGDDQPVMQDVVTQLIEARTEVDRLMRRAKDIVEKLPRVAFLPYHDELQLLKGFTGALRSDAVGVSRDEWMYPTDDSLRFIAHRLQSVTGCTVTPLGEVPGFEPTNAALGMSDAATAWLEGRRRLMDSRDEGYYDMGYMPPTNRFPAVDSAFRSKLRSAGRTVRRGEEERYVELIGRGHPRDDIALLPF